MDDTPNPLARVRLSSFAFRHGKSTVLFGRVLTGGVDPDHLVVDPQLHRSGHQGHLDRGRRLAMLCASTGI